MREYAWTRVCAQQTPAITKRKLDRAAHFGVKQVVAGAGEAETDDELQQCLRFLENADALKTVSRMSSIQPVLLGWLAVVKSQASSRSCRSTLSFSSTLKMLL